MMCKYRTLKQLLYLISFFIGFAVIDAFTLILKILMRCGWFRQQVDPDPPNYTLIHADDCLKCISP